jgi:peptidoglycan hydrolase CwlO-like protein
MDSTQQILITLGTIAGSAGLWKFFEARLKLKAEQRKDDIQNNDGVQYRDDLKNRVEKMSLDLEEANARILELTQKVAELETENRYLHREIDILKRR